MPRLLAALLLLALAPSLSAQETTPFGCGPFLLQPTSNSIVVVVDHPTEVTASISFGVKGKPVQVISHQTAARHHMFQLKGLTPGSVIEYRVRSSSSKGLDSGVMSFRTLPESPKSYRFLVMGDVRSDPTSWNKVSELALQRDPDALFIVGTGDYPNDGRRYKQWMHQFFAPARGLLGHFPFWPAIGNHEYTRAANGLTEQSDSHYFSLFELPGNERWFRVDYQFITLLILDSNSRMSPGSEQYEWLLTQLKSLRNRYTVSAFHHAPLTTGPHGKRLADGTSREWPVDEGRRFLSPLFEMYGVDIVFNGHDHLYEHSVKDGVDYVVTGGGGAPLYRVGQAPNRYRVRSRSVHHYCTVDVSPEEMIVTAVDKQGVVFDTFSFTADASSLARRKSRLDSRLRSSVSFGATSDGSLPLQVANLFRAPTHMVLTPEGAKEENSLLAVGETKTFAINVQSALSPRGNEPLSPHVHFKLPCVLSTTEQELNIRQTFTATTRIRRGSILARKQSSETSSMRFVLDHTTLVVKGANHHSGAGDIKATVGSSWVKEEFIVQVQIEDAAVMVEDAPSPLEKDGVLLLFAREIPGETMKQLLITADAGTLGPLSSKAGISTRKTETGWALEARIPAAALGFPDGLSTETSLLFDVLLIDRDSDTDDISHHRAIGETNSFVDTTELGRLILRQ